MDSLTHALTGAITGHAIGDSRLGPKAMLIGAVAANIPDSDVIFTRFFDPVEAMFVHRGFSHALILMVGGSLLLAYLLKRFAREQFSFGFWWLMVLLPWFSHLIMDTFNTYGTALFEPFSSIRVSFDSMAITDFNLVLILLFTLLALFLLRKKQHRYKQLVGIVGLVLVMLYFALNVFIKLSVEKEVKDRLKTYKIGFNRLHSTPLPLTNLVWMVVVEDSSAFRVSQVNILKKQMVSHTLLTKNGIDDRCSNPLRRIREFTKGYYTIDKDDRGYFYVNDIRFSSLEFGYPAAYVIRFKVNETTCTVNRTHPKRGLTPRNIRKFLQKAL
ncbi:MAG TPA: metal-dependent hydrolase [Bacteroidales bacterium]|nr:metal-dependent hydrolase [Bacteroidales bacterium]